MTYEEVSTQAERLSYRDKLRLAQLLVQLARKEEEAENPAHRADSSGVGTPDAELLQYVADRLRKLRPSKRDALLNSIGAMFQFQGGVSDSDKETIVASLLDRGDIVLDGDCVRYPGSEV